MPQGLVDIVNISRDGAAHRETAARSTPRDEGYSATLDGEYDDSGPYSYTEASSTIEEIGCWHITCSIVTRLG